LGETSGVEHVFFDGLGATGAVEMKFTAVGEPRPASTHEQAMAAIHREALAAGLSTGWTAGEPSPPERLDAQAIEHERTRQTTHVLADYDAQVAKLHADRHHALLMIEQQRDRRLHAIDEEADAAHARLPEPRWHSRLEPVTPPPAPTHHELPESWDEWVEQTLRPAPVRINWAFAIAFIASAGVIVLLGTMLVNGLLHR
jgi:hypothetical protein